MCKLFRICITLILAFIVSRTTTTNTKITNKVILGMIQDLVISSQDDGRQNNNTKLLITSIISRSQNMNQMYPIIHYETGLGSSADLKAENFSRLVTEVDNKARILLTIRISSPNDLHKESDAGKVYISLLKLLNRDAVKLEGISIEIENVNTFCDRSNELMSSLITKTKTSLRPLTRYSTVQVGYALNFEGMNCTVHHENIKTADFIIFKVPLQRNDNIFVESYGAFKLKFRNHIRSAENLFREYNSTHIYYQPTIKSEIFVNERSSMISENNIFTYVGHKEEAELKNIKSSLQNLNGLTGSLYEQLLAQYCFEWVLHDQAGINTIISYQYGFQNTNDPDWDHVTVIPYLTMLPLKNTLKDLQLPESASFLLQDVWDSGFNTVMISGDKWQELSKNIDYYITPCRQSKCRPENVMYLNNQNNAFANKNNSEIRNLTNIGDMKLTTLVFSTYYTESENPKWSRIVDIIKAKLVMRREKTCTEQFDFFENMRDKNFNKCDNTCHALTLKTLKGCGSLGISSQNIMWRGIVHIEKYTLSYFVENVMKKMDSLVIARQLLRQKYDQSKLAVFLRIIFNHTKIQSADENKSPVYCSPFYNQVYQYYEMILTWAKIHAFPIIIDSATNEYEFINPISWNQLATSRSVIIKGLMKTSPLFIRRSYNLSTVFGPEWNTGLYPCLPHAEDVNVLENLNFNHNFAGITINMNVRTSDGSLNSSELKVVLLYSLRKFNTVEVILLTENHIQTLYNVLSEQYFEMVLKQNSIYNRKFYLQVSSLQDEPIHEIVSKLQQFGFQVHITITNAQDQDIHHFATKHPNIALGAFQEICTSLAQKVISNRSDTSLTILSTNISYLICDTLSTPATNDNTTIMHEYLETHLYMQKLFQYFYPNLKEIRFRLHPLISNKTTNIRKNDMLNEMLFLTDVNNFAQGHQVHYFMLPVLPRENITKFQESSFWTVTRYEDLSDLSIYQEKLTAVLNMTGWLPMPTWTPPTTPTSTNSNGSMDSPENQRVSPSPFIIYVSVGAASIASFVVTLFVIMKARRYNDFLTEKEVKGFFSGKIETLEKAVSERKLSNTVKKSSNVYDGLVYQKDCEISKNDINVDRKVSICTSNKFSNKFRAKLQNGRDGDVLVEVSSKKCTREKFKAWMSEVKMLCYVGSHYNIVGFMGCYTSEIRKGVLWVVTEFCEEDSLENHLKSLKDTLNVRELTRFACEIAIGMEYISSQNIIHGDLRTRHVYLDQHKVCKVGDFGLPRKLLQYRAIVKKGKRERLPWRWMPCEAFQNLEFSVYSDVWSYGVTIWEIFSQCELPYGEDETFSQTFVAQVMKGKRLLCPSQATPEIFEKMQECWTLDPEMRSEFTELVQSFSGMLTSKADV